MASVKTSTDPGYKVDGRVSIAMDALEPAQKEAVGEILGDRSRFLASASDPGRVRRLSTTEPIYALKGPSGLRIIYSREGDTIEVIDLIHQLTLDRFGDEPSRPKAARRVGSSSASHSTKKAK